MEIIEKTKKSLNMPKEMADWLKQESQKQGLTVNALIITVLNDYRKKIK